MGTVRMTERRRRRTEDGWQTAEGMRTTEGNEENEGKAGGAILGRGEDRIVAGRSEGGFRRRSLGEPLMSFRNGGNSGSAAAPDRLRFRSRCRLIAGRECDGSDMSATLAGGTTCPKRFAEDGSETTDAR